ncbi:MAG TPA: hypothetical protein VFR31_18800 [Thermoanaerobaculia bacterium]|nr:hypothetical protein [Thermoanaerobaculia bacterium]
MMRYPILFGRRELIEGNGFVASVSVNGRALLTEDANGLWVEGVNPGGFAAQGDSRQEALSEFCSELRAVLFDIAADAGAYEEFRTSVEQFFQETNAAAAREWDEAVQEIRAGRVTADWLAQRPAESPLSVEVALIRQPQAGNNREGEAAIAA